MAARDILRKKQNVCHCSQSDESDDESVAAHFAQMQDWPNEEYINEREVAKYYRSLCASMDTLKNSAPVQKSYKSKAAQTEPDASGIPPSWILAGQKLVSELYDGLGNAINTLYHPPSDFSKENNAQGAGTNDPKNMKYFTYENGYWQSKLVPGVKIPDFGDLDRQRQIVHSEDFKKKLKNLMEIASKLRYLIPYVDTNLTLPIEMSDDTVPCSMENKSQQTEEANTQCETDGLVMTPPNRTESSADYSETSDVHSDVCIDVQPPEHTPKPSDDAKYSVGEISNDNQESISVIKAKVKKETKWKSAQMPGVIVSRYKLEPQAQFQVTNGAIRTRMDVKVPRIDAKWPAAINKNFITIRENSFQQDKHVSKFKGSNSIKGRVKADEVNSVKYNKIGIKKVKDSLNRNTPTIEKESICISLTNKGKPQKQLKTGTLISGSKNFIQKNILAARLQSNAAGPSNVNHESRPNVSQAVHKSKVGDKSLKSPKQQMY